MKKIILISCLVLLFVGLFGVGEVFAQPPDRFGLTEFEAAPTGLSQDSLPYYIANIIRWVLGIIGVLLVALLVYGGVTYMTSAGDEGRVETAKKVITYAIIGIVIVFAAYIISDYVISAVVGPEVYVVY